MNKNNYFGGITRKAAVVALGVLLVVFAAVFPALAYADDVCGDLQNADTVTLLSCLEQTDTRLTQNAEVSGSDFYTIFGIILSLLLEMEDRVAELENA